MATIDQCLEGATFPLDQIRHPSVGNNRNNQTLFLEIAITTTIPPKEPIELDPPKVFPLLAFEEFNDPNGEFWVAPIDWPNAPFF